MVGFALAEYCNGDDADPIRLPFADQYHARFLQRQAKAAAPNAMAASARAGPSSRRPRSPNARTRPPPATRSRRSAAEIQSSLAPEMQ